MDEDINLRHQSITKKLVANFKIKPLSNDIKLYY